MNKFWKVMLASAVGCIIALVALSIISMIGMIGSLVSMAAMGSVETSIPKSTVLKIDLSNPVSERSANAFTFDMVSKAPSYTTSTSLLSLLNAIDVASVDPAVKFIYMKTDNIKMSLSQMEEVRAALSRFRASGKAVVAYGTTLDNASCYMGSVADKVILHTFGDTMITGISASVLFFKGLLDNLGVEMQLIRHGKYKAAAESFVLEDMSSENREQNQAMLDAIWSSMVEEIAASRDFTAEQFNGWVDSLSIETPSDALRLGLVDQLCYQDELESYLCSLFGVDDPDDLVITEVEKYIGHLNSKQSPASGKEKIAVVYACGEIVDEGSDEGVIVGHELASTLSQVRRDSSVKAVVFRINSPGGSAKASEMINHELGLLREVKPVIASYGDYAASGGYWISVRSDKIFTDNTTLTGSIGVFGLIPNIGSAMEKTLKIHPVTITTNRHGDMVSGFKTLDSEEVRYIQASIEKIYTEFLSIVSDGRNMPVDKVDELGQGRVWAGKDALSNGLADTRGGLVDAIEYAKQVAGDSNYKVVEYPVQKSIFERIVESFMKADVKVPSNCTELLQSVYSSLKDEVRPCTYARVPYIYEIN